MPLALTERAVAAATSAATSFGLEVDGAVVLNASNRFVIRLTPCDVVARVTPLTHHTGSPDREVALAAALARTGSPVAPLEPRVGPRVVERDGFRISVWAHIEPGPHRARRTDDYAAALTRLHAGLREVDLDDAPHVLARVATVQADVADRDLTPDLADEDRALIAEALRGLGGRIAERGGALEQQLHGEPHPWNVLDTDDGLLFVDFENTCRGPVEYDLAWVPDAVAERTPGVDRVLLGECRGLVLAMVVAYRWRRGDRHPSGRPSGIAFLDVLRDGPPWPALPDIAWEPA